MKITRVESIKKIEQQFATGEEPVLVVCSNKQSYICKYMRNTASSYKLVCEFIGSIYAKQWKISTPPIAFVQIKKEHFSINSSKNLTAPAFGSQKLESVIDLNPTTSLDISSSVEIIFQLLTISLFDFWIANEDRNWNNSNLLYDIVNKKLVAIDHGCIFNTASFDIPLSQLTSTDSILYSDLFHHLTQNHTKAKVIQVSNNLEKEYKGFIESCKQLIPSIIINTPSEWNVQKSIIQDKLEQLFEETWIEDTLKNYKEILKENLDE